MSEGGYYMSYQVLYYNDLKYFCEEAFERFGFNKKDSAFITDVLLLSDLYGIDSHGTQRIVMYHDLINGGNIDIDAQPEIVMETPVSAVIDGKRGMGHLIARYAAETAIEKAKLSGIGIVTVRNSNHYGIAGYYSKMACNEGLIGISMTNSRVSVVPTFSKTPMLGTNPFAFCIPANPQPFNFDAATSVVPIGKIEVYNKEEKPIPLGWGMNVDGYDETDPAEVLKGVLSGKSGVHPVGGGTEEFGGHKGYGYAMVVEIFCSILSMGTTSNHIMEKAGQSGICHFIAAIDPKIFGDPSAIQRHLETYLDEIRHSEKAAGRERIYTHGEKEAEAYAKRMKDGILVNNNTISEMKNLADDLNMDLYQYFPDLKPLK